MGVGTDVTTVFQATPQITTEVSDPTLLPGQSVTDTATITVPAGAPAPTGSVSFLAYGPDNPTCTGAAAFVSNGRPVTGSPNGTATSEQFTATLPGTYRFVAVYTGDANYTPISAPCGAPDESFVLAALPTITVDKSASPSSLPEPGGTFTFSAQITNTSSQPVTITTLTDNIYGNIATQGTCTTAIGTVLAGGGTYTCSFSGNFTGNAHAAQTDIVTATAIDDGGNPATDSDDAVVTITDVPPSVSVDKTANPVTRLEPGGSFTFTVVVSNTSAEPVTITALTDDVYGNIANQGTCGALIGDVLAPGASSAPCTFDGDFNGNSGDTQTDTVTATVVDDDGSTGTDTDGATVGIGDALPLIEVDKSADPLSLPAPGGDFRFNLRITNPGTEPITVDSLTDDVYGNLNGRGSCATGATLAPAPGSSSIYECSFVGAFTGKEGDTQTDTVTAAGEDDENNKVSDADSATVSLGAPSDEITCNGVPANVVGTNEGETINGTSGRDVIAALPGDDVIRGLGGDDLVCGGKGLDIVNGNRGDDFLRGGSGRDQCNGGPGVDDAYRSCQKITGVP
jgi:hypothetical protein